MKWACDDLGELPRTLEANGENGSAASRTRHPDCSIHAFQEATANGQTETRAWRHAVTQRIAIELFEYLFSRLFWDSGSLIGNLKDHKVLGVEGSQLNLCVGRRIFGGIVEHVEQDLLEQCEIRTGETKVFRYRYVDDVICQHGLAAAKSALDYVRNVRGHHPGLQVAGFEPRDIEQVSNKS